MGTREVTRSVGSGGEVHVGSRGEVHVGSRGEVHVGSRGEVQCARGLGKCLVLV